MKRKVVFLLNIYKKMSLPVKASFWFTICNFAQRGITMITTPVFTRILSEEQYGLASTFFSWQTVLFMVTTLSLYQAMMNLYVKYDSDKEGTLSAMCGLGLLITSAWFVVSVIFRKQLSQILGISQTLTICLFAIFIAQFVIQCWGVCKRYLYEYKAQIVVTMMMTGGSGIAGAICVLTLSDTAEGRIVPQTIITLIIGAILYISIFKRKHVFYNKSVWVFALTYSIPLLPHFLSEFVLSSSDKLMINYMCGPKDVALYSVAYSVGTLIQLVTSAVNASFSPYQYQKIKAGQFDVLAKRANEVLALIAVMLIGIMIFSREIVFVFGGEKYLESAGIIIPICVGIFFNYLFQIFARVQHYYVRRLMIVIPSIACAVLNLILNYIFIDIFDYRAAAYTTFFCYLIFCILHYIFYQKVCQEELDGQKIYDIKTIVIISVCVILAGIVLNLLNQYFWLKYSIIILALITMMIFRKEIKGYFGHIFSEKRRRD